MGRESVLCGADAGGSALAGAGGSDGNRVLASSAVAPTPGAVGITGGGGPGRPSVAPCAFMEDDARRRLACVIAIKCADLGHATRPFDLHRKWTDLVTEEFFMQGDRERALGLPVSPLCDRRDFNLCKVGRRSVETLVPSAHWACSSAQSQIGFISFMVKPITEEWASFCASPGARQLVECMSSNLSRWQVRQRHAAGARTDSI